MWKKGTIFLGNVNALFGDLRKRGGLSQAGKGKMEELCRELCIYHKFLDSKPKLRRALRLRGTSAAETLADSHLHGQYTPEVTVVYCP